MTATPSLRTPSRVEVAVFAAGVASMGLEILAGRLLAPTFGSSVFVWGSIIGVFLAALSAGYWVAGRRAADHASPRALGGLLVLAACYVAVVIAAGEFLVEAFGSFPLPFRFRPLAPVTALFGPPTFLLGFVSPYAAELVDARSTGDASGRVYALGTSGSIVGAFGTTFFLLPALGITGVELVFGLLLVGAAALVAPGRGGATTAGAALAALLLLAAYAVPALGVAGVVHQEQTAYQELRVVDEGDVRTLYLDGAPHSAMYLDNPDRYVFEYTRYFHLPYLFREDVDRVLFVGGGGFSGPKRFLREYPNVTVDVVEIDPAVVEAARRYFDVPDSPRLNVHVMDGRRYLRQTNHTYDVIVLDAYRADRVPYHLTTVEFMRLVNRRLDSRGVVVANVISSTDGPDSAFYRAEYRTMNRVFPQVYSFPTAETSALQNIELVATKQDERVSQATLVRRNRARDIGIDLSEAVSHYRAGIPVGDAPLLRDGDAPVDSLLARQVDTRYVIARSNRTETPS